MARAASLPSTAMPAFRSTPDGVGTFASYRRSDNYSAIVYTATDGNIYELTFQGDGWHYANLCSSYVTVGGAPQPAVGSDPIALARGDGYNAVYYRTSDGHVHEISLYSGHWHHTDFTVALGGTSAANAGNNLSAFLRADGTTYVLYVGSDSHIHAYVLASGSWSNRDLSSDAASTGDGSLPYSMLSNTTPFGYHRNDGYDSIVYRGSDSHVREITIDASNHASHWDLTLAGGAAVTAQADPMGYVRKDGLSSSVVYYAADGVHEISNLNGWHDANLTTASGAPLSNRSSTTQLTPMGWVRGDGYNSVLFVVSLNVNGVATNDLWEMWLLNGQWHSANLSLASGERVLTSPPPPPCGQLGSNCCSDIPGGNCDVGLICASDRVCVSNSSMQGCGGSNQACCSSGCYGYNFCNSSGLCEPCGQSGQPCCPDMDGVVNWCSGMLYCHNSTDHTCSPSPL